MRIFCLVLLVLYGVVVNVQASKETVGYGILQVYRSYAQDFRTRPSGVALTIAKGLVSSKGADQLASFDEFAMHIYDKKTRTGYNSKGLGATTDPPSNWGMNELRPNNPSSFLPKGFSMLNAKKLLPDWHQARLARNGGKFIPPKMGEILFEVTKLNKDFLKRPEKPGVDKLKTLAQIQELGQFARQARWAEMNSFMVKNFNLHFKNEGYTARTVPYKMLDGSVIDMFDRHGTYTQSSDADATRTIERWIRNYGTDATEFTGGKDAEANAKEIKAIKGHAQVVQDYNESNRLLVSGDMCSWHGK